jgi:hypothetical protein
LVAAIPLLARHPRRSVPALRAVPSALRGLSTAHKWLPAADSAGSGALADDRWHPPLSNPLRDYFEAHRQGRGIWKMRHYLEIYHRHFQKFVGREVHIAEVGVYSGGSLDMWRNYFGPRSRVYGIDIEPACKAYESDGVRIFIGDQADRGFWRGFRAAVPRLDILIDDGGHEAEQQIATLEEMLPHLAPGGVYLCEDVVGLNNDFAAYLRGLSAALNKFAIAKGDVLEATASPFQKAVGSVHLYPFAAVIERTDVPVQSFVAPKHGSEWQPFL